MFPIWDDQVKWWHKPIFTWLFIVINVVIFLYQVSLGEAWWEAFIYQYATIPARIMQGEWLYTLITSMFMHGGWMHLIGNMLFLWVFGDNIEARLGNIKFLFFYLWVGLIGSFAHILTDPSSLIPSLGASGAISWVLWAYLVMFPWSRIKIRNPASWQIWFAAASKFLIYWIVLQFFSGVWSLAAAGDWWVAYFAHIWWFIAWLVFGKVGKALVPEKGGEMLK